MSTERKAQALIDSDSIAEVDARVFVAASSKPHAVVLFGNGATSCTCTAGQHNVPCFHLLAARRLAGEA